MEPIVSSETSATKSQTPGNYPKRNKLQVNLAYSSANLRTLILATFNVVWSIRILFCVFRTFWITLLYLLLFSCILLCCLCSCLYNQWVSILIITNFIIIIIIIYHLYGGDLKLCIYLKLKCVRLVLYDYMGIIIIIIIIIIIRTSSVITGTDYSRVKDWVSPGWRRTSFPFLFYTVAESTNPRAVRAPSQGIWRP